MGPSAPPTLGFPASGRPICSGEPMIMPRYLGVKSAVGPCKVCTPDACSGSLRDVEKLHKLISGGDFAHRIFGWAGMGSPGRPRPVDGKHPGVRSTDPRLGRREETCGGSPALRLSGSPALRLSGSPARAVTYWSPADLGLACRTPRRWRARHRHLSCGGIARPHMAGGGLCAGARNRGEEGVRHR